MRKRRLVILQLDTKVLRILNWKFKSHVLMCQTVVDASEGIQLGFNVNLVLGIKVDLKGLGTIDLMANSLANNLSWEDNIFKDLFMNMG